MQRGVVHIAEKVSADSGCVAGRYDRSSCAGGGRAHLPARSHHRVAGCEKCITIHWCSPVGGGETDVAELPCQGLSGGVHGQVTKSYPPAVRMYGVPPSSSTPKCSQSSPLPSQHRTCIALRCPDTVTCERLGTVDGGKESCKCTGGVPEYGINCFIDCLWGEQLCNSCLSRFISSMILKEVE